jgi:hypothetical protein
MFSQGRRRREGRCPGMASTKLVAAFTLGVGAASAAALVIEWMRRRNKDVRELLADQSMEGLAALRHVSRQNPIPVPCASTSLKLVLKHQ